MKKVEIIFTSAQSMPKYATQGSAAVDLIAVVPETIILKPNKQVMISSGIALNMPKDLCALLLPRSGLGTKGYSLANTIGLIDSDYQGEIKMCIKNTSDKPIEITPHMRLAQLMFISPIQPMLELVKTFSDTTERGSGGFGSTGTN